MSSVWLPRPTECDSQRQARERDLDGEGQDNQDVRHLRQNSLHDDFSRMPILEIALVTRQIASTSDQELEFGGEKHPIWVSDWAPEGVNLEAAKPAYVRFDRRGAAALEDVDA